MARNGLSDAIRAELKARGWVTAADLTTVMRQLGVAEDERNVRSILNARVNAREFIREKRGAMLFFGLNPEFVPVSIGEGVRLRDNAAVPAMAPTFGAPCLAPLIAREATATIASDALEAVEGVLEDQCERFSLDDLAEALCDDGWTRADIAGALKAGIAAGRIASDSNQFWKLATLSALPVEAALVETRGASESPGVHTSAEQLGVQASGDAPREARAASTVIETDSIGLRARLEAIACDIEEALQDACDALLPHALIKALSQAQGGANRALRQLEA